VMMLSAVYQQSSEETPAPGTKGPKMSAPVVQVKLQGTNGSGMISASQADPGNKLLWRMNRQRLDFESLRDSLLCVSGQLDKIVGGKAEDIFKAPFSKRRSIYGFIDRQFLPGAFRVFDFANPDMHSPQRSETTVPQQALFFMNAPFVVEQARALAAQAGADGKGIPEMQNVAEEKIRKLYRIVYQREPTPRQLQQGLGFVNSNPIEQAFAEHKEAGPWKYGYGEFDETTKKVKSFEPLPHFNGDAWQGGKAWPDEKLGWAQLTASGGHAGNDRQHAVIRRWVAPMDGTAAIEATLKHAHQEGHGIRAWIFSSRKGLLGDWSVHNQSVETKFDELDVKEGDTIDFIISINQSLNNNDFVWSPVIHVRTPTVKAKRAPQWSAEKDFSGPPGEAQKPLTPWEQYAQVLLLSNEFLFID